MNRLELIHLTPEELDERMRTMSERLLEELRDELGELRTNLLLLKAWLTEDEAALYLSISKRSVQDRRRAGEIRAIQRGQKFYFKREWLDAYLEADGLAAPADGDSE